MGTETAGQPEMTHEVVNDIPVLMHVIKERLGMMAALDSVVKRHGNRLGMSVGEVMGTWLAHILSAHNHFMSHVQDWAIELPNTLGQLLGHKVLDGDLADDRLAEVLDEMSVDGVWHSVERSVNQNMIRAYKLKVERVRLDTTTVSVYSDEPNAVLFQRGYSKDHRPDLRQFKVMAAALDPLGVLVGVDVVSGEQADDVLYVPMIERLQTDLGPSGILYVGDTKMSALKTRAYIQQTNNRYLAPLASVGEVPKQMAEWIAAAQDGRAKTVELRGALDAKGKPGAVIGRAYELTREVREDAEKPGWNERVMIVQSDAYAEAARKSLRERIARAKTEIQALCAKPGSGRRVFSDVKELHSAALALAERRDVAVYVSWNIRRCQGNPKRKRAYGKQPARVEFDVWLEIDAQTNAEALAHAEYFLGWRAYVSNASEDELSLEDAVLTYRDEWLIERDFARLKGRVLSIAPVWLKRENRAVGMARLLTLGVRVLALIEHEARLKIKAEQTAITGLYKSRKNRATDIPTTERMLTALSRIILTTIRIGDQVHRHISSLSQTQQRIVDLAGCPPDTYQRLIGNLGFS
jgi:transposase